MPLQLIAHRGLPNVYPESSMVAYRSSVSVGAKHVECDCHLLADGVLGIMHDPTLNRTTTSSGNVADQTSASWSLLQINAASLLGGSWTNVPVPTLDQVLGDFANRAIVMPEAKVSGSGAAIVAKLKQYCVRPEMAIVQSFTASELFPALAEGYQTMFLMNTYTGTPDAATLAATGYTWIGLASTVATSYMDALRLAGLRVAVFTLNTRNALLPLSASCDAVFSDEAIYLGSTRRLVSDPFKSQTWYHGHIKGNSSGGGGGRGAFYSPNMWGLDVSASNIFASSLMGWASPIGGGETCGALKINFTVTFASALMSTRWASLAILDTDKPFNSDSAGSGLSGYHFICSKEGSLSMYRMDNGAPTLLDTKNGGAVLIPDGGSANYRITITATTVKLERLDSPIATSTISDYTYRGAYLHAGAKGSFAKFSAISITDIVP